VCIIFLNIISQLFLTHFIIAYFPDLGDLNDGYTHPLIMKIHQLLFIFTLNQKQCLKMSCSCFHSGVTVGQAPSTTGDRLIPPLSELHTVRHACLLTTANTSYGKQSVMSLHVLQ